MKWASVLHHITNDHDWLLGSCEHPPLTGPPTDSNGKEIIYFNMDEPAFKPLRKIVMDKAWLKSLGAYVKFRYNKFVCGLIVIFCDRHTGMLESFHSLLLTYCLKRTAYKCVFSLEELGVMKYVFIGIKLTQPECS